MSKQSIVDQYQKSENISQIIKAFQQDKTSLQLKDLVGSSLSFVIAETFKKIDRPYLLIFDKFGADTLNDIFKMGENSAKATKKSTMMVESHITYNQELLLNDEVDINCVFFDHDKKRLQYKMEMIHKEKKFLASTIEVLALYVDLNTRKVTEFESKKIQIMDDYIKSNFENFDNKDLKFSSKLKK